jgi:hypothetical protein
MRPVYRRRCQCQAPRRRLEVAQSRCRASQSEQPDLLPGMAAQGVAYAGERGRDAWSITKRLEYVQTPLMKLLCACVSTLSARQVTGSGKGASVPDSIRAWAFGEQPIQPIASGANTATCVPEPAKCYRQPQPVGILASVAQPPE